MNSVFEIRDHRRRFKRQHLPWIIPLGLVLAAVFVFCLGDFVVWLWRETVVDLFGFKPISFWQAWGLILLSQILFKANVRPMVRTGPRRARFMDECAARSPESAPPPGNPTA